MKLCMCINRFLIFIDLIILQYLCCTGSNLIGYEEKFGNWMSGLGNPFVILIPFLICIAIGRRGGWTRVFLTKRCVSVQSAPFYLNARILGRQKERIHLCQLTREMYPKIWVGSSSFSGLFHLEQPPPGRWGRPILGDSHSLRRWMAASSFVSFSTSKRRGNRPNTLVLKRPWRRPTERRARRRTRSRPATLIIMCAQPNGKWPCCPLCNNNRVHAYGRRYQQAPWQWRNDIQSVQRPSSLNSRRRLRILPW